MRVEPSAPVRIFAIMCFEAYQAFRDAGFEHEDAMRLLIKHMEIAAQ